MSATFSFLRKSVVVTGAAAGLGADLSRAFAKAGAGNLFLVDQQDDKRIQYVSGADENTNTLEGVAAKLRTEFPDTKVHTAFCDISDESQVKSMAENIRHVLGSSSSNGLDVLVNNAGTNGGVSLVEDMQTSNWEHTIRVNLTGTMMVTRELTPLLKEAGAPSSNTTKANCVGGGAAIVNISSNVSKRGLPLRADYVCSKWALLGLTQTLALELVNDGVRCNAVCPGPINVDRIDQVVAMHAEMEGKTAEDMRAEWEGVPMQRFVESEEVTNAVMFLASSASSAMTGQAHNITGGFLMD